MNNLANYEVFSNTPPDTGDMRTGCESPRLPRCGRSLILLRRWAALAPLCLPFAFGCAALSDPDPIAVPTSIPLTGNLQPFSTSVRQSSKRWPVANVDYRHSRSASYDGLRRLPNPDMHLADDFARDLLADCEDLERLPTLGQGMTYPDLFESQYESILNDHAEFYSRDGLRFLAFGFAAGAIMANTSFDENVVRNAYIENIVLSPEDDLYETLHEPKFLGDGLYTIPVFAAAALAEPLIADWPGGPQVSEWGQRSLRAFLVGTPPMLALQAVTGGSRPGESTASSDWKLFQDNNGVSGHSFMGAIPFMSAARMTENFWLKGGLYAASTLPAISRVNDDAHYFSQAFLGWWLAYAATSAIDRTELLPGNVRMQPVVTADTFGWIIQVSY